MGRHYRNVVAIGLIALGTIVFAEGVGGRHLAPDHELGLGLRGGLTFFAALIAGTLGVLALDDLDVRATAYGVGLVLALTLGLEHAGAPGSIAILGTVLTIAFAAVAGSCTVVAALREVRRTELLSRAAAAGFLVYGICTVGMLGAIAIAGVDERAAMLRPLAKHEPGGSILTSVLMGGIVVGLAAAWWLIPRAHVLELALGASVVIEAVARLGGGGFDAPGLGFIMPLAALALIVRVRSGRLIFPKRKEPTVEPPSSARPRT